MMLESDRKETKEQSLIETIAIISRDNAELKQQTEALEDALKLKQRSLVVCLAQLRT